MAIKAIPPHSREGVLEGTAFSRTWSKFFEDISKRIGGAKGYNLGGLITSDTSARQNVGTGEDNLISYSLEKNILNNVGDVLEFRTFGSFANNANSKTLKVYLGSTVVLSLTATTAFQNVQWIVDTSVIRTSATTQFVVCDFSCFGVTFTAFTNASEDFTTATTIKCTGEAVSTGDIIQYGLIVKFFPIT